MLVPDWLLELLFMSLVLEGELEAGAAEFWSVVVEGAAVGFAWLGVWSVTAGDELAGAAVEGVAEFWLDEEL